jgi:hypothetical protein
MADVNRRYFYPIPLHPNLIYPSISEEDKDANLKK